MKKILLFSILICFVFSSRYEYHTTIAQKKANKKLYTMWGLGIPGHNNGSSEYKDGYNLLGFYFPNTENSLHGFNMTLINLEADFTPNNTEHVLMAYSIMIFPDLKTNQDEFYVRADIGLNKHKYYRNYWGWNYSEEDTNLGALVGVGYKLKTKKDGPYVMFELTSHFGDVLENVEGFLDGFSDEPEELFDVFEQNFLKGNWNLTVSVMADITKK